MGLLLASFRHRAVRALAAVSVRPLLRGLLKRRPRLIGRGTKFNADGLLRNAYVKPIEHLQGFGVVGVLQLDRGPAAVDDLLHLGGDLGRIHHQPGGQKRFAAILAQHEAQRRAPGQHRLPREFGFRKTDRPGDEDRAGGDVGIGGQRRAGAPLARPLAVEHVENRFDLVGDWPSTRTVGFQNAVVSLCSRCLPLPRVQEYNS
jgi:hypothetical protein